MRVGFYPKNLAEFGNNMFDQKFEFKPPKTSKTQRQKRTQGSSIFNRFLDMSISLNHFTMMSSKITL